MTAWYTSDLHLGHHNVALTRGFEDSAAHDQALAEYWQKTVKPEDHLWILGDTQLSAVQYALDFISRMPGIKHLVVGNHDPCHPMHRHAFKFQRRYMEVFESVQTFQRRRIAGVDVLLSHFPYSTDHTDVVRYTQYRLRDEGRWLLHGHTHGREQLHGHEIHVGLDAWNFQFVNHDTIDLIIRTEERNHGPASPTRT